MKALVVARRLIASLSAVDYRLIRRLFRTICAPHVDTPITSGTRDMYTPRIAAHLAVLDKSADNVWFDVDLAFFAAVRTSDNEVIVHS